MGSEVCMHLGQVRKVGQEPWHLTGQAINVSKSTDLFSRSEKFTSQKEERREEWHPDWGEHEAFYSLSQKEPHLSLSLSLFFFLNSKNKKLISPSPVTMVTKDPSAQSDGLCVFSPRIALEAHDAVTSKQGSGEDNPHPSLDAEMHFSEQHQAAERSRMASQTSAHQGRC